MGTCNTCVSQTLPLALLESLKSSMRKIYIDYNWLQYVTNATPIINLLQLLFMHTWKNNNKN